ncbi:TetR/AcrR family transcriptional regulator C-terminal domain-containing protein [Glycomyces salinus]|uniref:TetR/AcrR family transcriptional regulator C-terminal domain-containing protein n=1 Tax=Glycomyces salinus TaxID=980294 RepID=UPI0018EC427B|nr:TetR/AcrR family transcriptional regulator C-terminal domain-containing protein [Glycomyces salinus]
MARRGEAQVRLTRGRVLEAACALADEDGLASLTMRSLAASLGVEAMSLYHHVAGKQAVLDGLVDLVMAEIERAVAEADGPEPERDWKTAMRVRVLTAREVMLRHPWAPGLIESRGEASFSIVRYLDGVVGLMVRGGFSYGLAHRALHALESRALGFSQEMFRPGGDDDGGSLEAVADQVPNLAAMVAAAVHDQPDTRLGWCDDQAEFEFALDLILDGLDRLRGRE